MRNASDKSCREKQNTFYVQYHLNFSENCAVIEIMWKNVVELDRPQVLLRVHFACQITKARAHTY